MCPKLMANPQAECIGKEMAKRKQSKSSLFWAQHLCFESPFDRTNGFVQSLSGGDERSEANEESDVDDDSEDDMMDLLPSGGEDGDSHGSSSDED